MARTLHALAFIAERLCTCLIRPARPMHTSTFGWIEGIYTCRNGKDKRKSLHSISDRVDCNDAVTTIEVGQNRNAIKASRSKDLSYRRPLRGADLKIRATLRRQCRRKSCRNLAIALQPGRTRRKRRLRLPFAHVRGQSNQFTM